MISHATAQVELVGRAECLWRSTVTATGATSGHRAACI